MQLRTMQQQDLEQVRDIADARLGETYEYSFEQIVADDDRPALVAVRDGTVLGFCFGVRHLDQDELRSRFGEVDVPGPGGLLKSVAVREDVEGQGIGSRLCERLIDALDHPVYALSWLREDHRDSSGLFEALGFEALVDIDRFWYADSRGKEDYCPDCGAPCTCTARVYVLEG